MIGGQPLFPGIRKRAALSAAQKVPDPVPSRKWVALFAPPESGRPYLLPWLASLCRQFTWRFDGSSEIMKTSLEPLSGVVEIQEGDELADGST